eukprot:TRINITY_DN276_c0_g4_i1.p1 TRINITY_DN276_c0_g4~~TRINITY_DN276_c0_g4_i1.p1  ORF type:complete len:172 (-),score=48.36 TRINITY_DN276_c0_g4_i1:620-1135(-)
MNSEKAENKVKSPIKKNSRSSSRSKSKSKSKSKSRSVSRSSSSSSPSRSRSRSNSNSKSRSKSRSRSRRGSPSRNRSRSRHRHSPRRRSRTPEPATVCIGRITRNINENHLREIFSNYGKIKKVEVIIDRKINISKGFAYVEFENADEADTARAYLDGLNFQDDINQYFVK